MTRLKTDISPGLDGISAKEVVNNIDTLLLFITDLLNMSIRQALVPTNMKTTVLRPIYKKGNHKNFSNYRPIALQETLLKILEFYLADTMGNFIEKNELIIRQQYGYKQGIGTTDLLEHFSETVKQP